MVDAKEIKIPDIQPAGFVIEILDEDQRPVAGVEFSVVIGNGDAKIIKTNRDGILKAPNISEIKLYLGEEINEIHNIEGRILDFQDKPVVHASVIIKSDKAEYRVQTDENGVYTVENVPEGNYIIMVDDTLEGFEEYEGAEEKITVMKE
jgi:hypothetical protein